MWDFFDGLMARLSEPSTYAGLAMMLPGVNMALDFNEAPAVAEGVAAAGQLVAQGLPPWMAIVMGGLGALATIKSEKGKRR